MKPALAALLLLVVTSQRGGDTTGDGSQQPSFKGGVDLVMLSVAVHDQNGRLVPGLSRIDFELFDAGERRPIVTFRSEQTSISLAVLFDVSGSMDVAARLTAGRDAVRHVVSWLEPGRDQVALFTFDTQLRELQRFTTTGADLFPLLDELKPFGSTSLYDSIADTGRRLAAQGGERRAIVVVTDGIDNGSQMTPDHVSSVASGLDVPVYLLMVVAPLDRRSTETAVDRADTSTPGGALDELTRATGGGVFVVSGPSHASLAARRIVDELRHQYLIAFEPSAVVGWHPLTVRTRDSRFIVRTRSGYVAGPQPARPH